MKDVAWLVVNAKGIVRVVKGRRAKWHTPERPALSKGEYAVLVSVTVPDSAFAPTPLPTAHIEVPESALVAPTVEVTVEQPPEEVTE